MTSSTSPSLTHLDVRLGDMDRAIGRHAGDAGGSGDYGRGAATRPQPEVDAVTDTLRDELGVPSVEAFFREVGADVAAVLPEDTQVVFEIEGQGGGTWTMARKPTGIEVIRGHAVWADSVLRCSVRRFVDLVTGRLDGRRAFFDGTLHVEGDVGLLLRLSRALPEAA